MTAIELSSELGDDQKMIWETVRDLAAERIAPLAVAIDRTGTIPAEVRSMIAELGLYGITAPEAAGGAGMDAVALWATALELGAASAGLAAHFVSTVVKVVEPLAASENAAVRARLEAILSGACKVAFVGDERVATKDEAQATLKLESHGSGYLLNGRALDVLDGGSADLFLVAPSLGSWVVVSATADGVSRSPKPSRLGLRGASVADLSFENTKLSAEDVVFSAERGLSAKTAAAARTACLFAAVAAGVMRAALREAVTYGKDRKQFGKSITDFEAMREKIAGIRAAEVSAVALSLTAARALARGENAGVLARIALLTASEGAVRATDDALQIHGGYGFSQEYAVERLYRDAATIAAVGGGADLLRLDIAGETLAD